MQTKQELLLSMPVDFLLSFVFKAKLLRNIWSDLTKKDLVHALLRALTQEQCRMLKTEYDEQRCYDKTLESYLFYRPTANRLCDDFIEKFLNAQKGIIVRELRLNGTRVDIAQFNGFSEAYELKTSRDTFSRLQRQISLYSNVFEFVNLVCDEQLADDIPSHVGVIEVKRINGDFQFARKRKAMLNHEIDGNEQLNLFRQVELRNLVQNILGHPQELPRIEMVRMLNQELNGKKINQLYKETMVKRLGLVSGDQAPMNIPVRDTRLRLL